MDYAGFDYGTLKIPPLNQLGIDNAKILVFVISVNPLIHAVDPRRIFENVLSTKQSTRLQYGGHLGLKSNGRGSGKAPLAVSSHSVLNSLEKNCSERGF